jgi:succinate-semialdehyde dehydrogenase/glutarate-semialdehyde dehydrogenase
MKMKSINPATQESIAEYEIDSDKIVSQVIENAQKTWLKFKETSISKRSEYLLKVAQLLRNNKECYGKLITLEMGKPIKQSVAEVEKCAWVCEYYANNAEKILKNEVIETEAAESYVRFDPIGIVLAVMPWNFPFWQVFRFAAPALMAGNVCLLKHASNVPGCSLLIQHIFELAGFPKFCFNSLLISSSQVEAVIRNPLVKAATLTGSEPAGKSIATIAGSCIKKTVLELGGSDPFIILEDADLEAAAKTAVNARLLANGQSCIAAKRFIVTEKVYDKFVDLFVENMKKIRVGNPIEPDIDLGPLVRKEALEELDHQVTESVKLGATVLLGGKKIEGLGCFYEPTILTNVKKGMPAYSEEVFGPVAAVIKVKDEKEAIKVANDTVFGLGASLWTNDLEKAKMLVAKINAGNVFVNELVKSDPRLPFGGVGVSGYGRELSHYGIKEFVNIKTVYINK